MAMPDAYRAISLLEFNVGAAGAVALLNPLAAQIDSLIALGIGPAQANLAAQFNAAIALNSSLAISASLGSLSIAASIASTLAAVAQLQAALAASVALGIQPPSLNISASAGLAAALKLELAGIQLLIQLALELKIPAIRAAAALSASLNAGPFFAISFSGVPLQTVSNWLTAEVGAGGLVADGHQLLPGDPTFGVLIFGANPSIQASFNAIIAVPAA